MQAPFDLDAYLSRVGYDGPTKPDLASLGGLLAAHMNAIPFENIDVLLGRPIRLDLEALQKKMVTGRRGGYCFEQATLFLAALSALGFEATPRTARVILVLKPEAAPRGHMYLAVRLPEGEFVADPGLGGMGCRAPIPLDGRPAREGDEIWSIRTENRRRVLQVESPERRIDAWIAGFDEDNWVDFEVGNHWFSTHPASPMVNRMMLRAMIPGGGRVTVMNREATIRANGEIQRRELADRTDLRRLVRDYCGFDCPEIETMRVPSAPGWG
jgi:N-hydroxyarylamine O-acetyltransferase